MEQKETAIEMIVDVAAVLHERDDTKQAMFLLGAADALYMSGPEHPSDPIYMAAYRAAAPYCVLPPDESEKKMEAQQTLYVLRVLDGNGALTGQGEYAETPELARELRGELRCGPGNRLVLTRVERLPGYWADKQGNEHPRLSKPVVIEIEPASGAWGGSRLG